MADTCVLGHAWTPGRVLCAVCGFGPRAIQPGQDEPTAQDEPAAAPELATVGAAATARNELSGQLDEPVAYQQPAAQSEPAAAEQVLSPDGHWAWDGTQWVPAVPEPTEPSEPSVPAAAAQADLTPEPSHRGQRTHRRVDPKLLLGLVLVLAVAAAADIALKLPPLGHKTSHSSAAVVHRASAPAKGTPGHASNAVDHDLARVAGAEAKAYTTSRAFVAAPAVLRHDGATTTAGDRVLVAAKGLSYCAVVGTPGSWYVLDSHFAGTLGTVVFPTPVAAESTCRAGLGAFSSL